MQSLQPKVVSMLHLNHSTLVELHLELVTAGSLPSGHQQMCAWPLLPRTRRNLRCHFDHNEVPVSPGLASAPVAVSAALFLTQLRSSAVGLPGAWSPFLVQEGSGHKVKPREPSPWQGHVPSPCSRHPTSPRALSEQPTTPKELNASNTWKHPRSRQPQRSVEGPELPPAVRFCVIA